MKNQLNIRYVVELVITVALILVITVVLARMFALSRVDSVGAKRLTEAVTVASSVAETEAAAKDREDFVALLAEGFGAEVSDGGDVITVLTRAADGGGYAVTVRETENVNGRTGLTESTIEVRPENAVPGSEALYTLETGCYRRSEEARP
ncbi:MAG: hypothetical protein ACOX8R_04990 [Bacillota bacterium]|jgi:hypothetical protein